MNTLQRLLGTAAIAALALTAVPTSALAADVLAPTKTVAVGCDGDTPKVSVTVTNPNATEQVVLVDVNRAQGVANSRQEITLAAGATQVVVFNVAPADDYYANAGIMTDHYVDNGPVTFAVAACSTSGGTSSKLLPPTKTVATGCNADGTAKVSVTVTNPNQTEQVIEVDVNRAQGVANYRHQITLAGGATQVVVFDVPPADDYSANAGIITDRYGDSGPITFVAGPCTGGAAAPSLAKTGGRG